MATQLLTHEIIMGMFDYLTCKYPLPLAGANDLEYQTKDTREQWLDRYEIREDGTLWHEAYDTEDHSELAKWEAAHPGQKPPDEISTGLAAFGGCMTRVNARWEQEPPFTGEVTFGCLLGDGPIYGWLEWSSYFVDGKLKEIHLIEHRPQPT